MSKLEDWQVEMLESIPGWAEFAASSASDFDEAYARLAEVGKCDSPFGKEYQRVLGEWLAEGKPEDIEEFIVRRANIRPE